MEGFADPRILHPFKRPTGQPSAAGLSHRRISFMKANLPIRVRYVGVFPKNGYREYDFHVEAEDKTIHRIVLLIDDILFLEKQLMFQEAPDLCYQKLRMDLINETVAQIGSRVRVTPLDVASYRDSHPSVKSRNKR
jgi:hypothetical protein